MSGWYPIKSGKRVSIGDVRSSTARSDLCIPVSAYARWLPAVGRISTCIRTKKDFI